MNSDQSDLKLIKSAKAGEMELGKISLLLTFNYLPFNLISIVLISPERAAAPEWSELFNSTHFLAKIVGIAFDEAHTICQW